MTINFNYCPFDEDVVIVGKKGSGKTERAKKILSAIRNLPYWVYDFQGDKFTNFGKVCKTVKELEAGTQCILQPTDKSKETFIEFCNKVHFEIAEQKGNLVICIDELHQYINHKNQSIPELYTIVMSDRNKGISGIYISTVHTAIPNWILTNVEHVFAYTLGNQAHIDWLETYIGHEAWLLLPVDKRKKLIDDTRILQKYGYIYRKQSDALPQVELGNG